LEKILSTAREIKEVIHKVGRTLAPADAVPVQGPEKREKLRGKRVLVVDGDESIRCSAHSLLEPHDCVVEKAQRGSEAAVFSRGAQRDLIYNAVFSGVKLPNMSGFDLIMKLKPMIEPVPLILS